MKHAGTSTLNDLSNMLDVLREVRGLTERSPGIFYSNGGAFLHFHEDPAGVFADVKLSGKDFTRFRVNTAKERRALLKLVIES